MTSLFDNIPYGISANILGGGFSKHALGWTETKTKNFHTIWSITEGEITVTVGANSYTATKGDAILFSPGDTYSASSNIGCAFTFLFFTLKTGNSLDLLSDLNPSGIIAKEYISASFDSFNASFIEQRRYHRHGDIKLYSKFFGYISDVICAIKNGGIERFCHGKYSMDSDMRTAIEYINKNYESAPTIREIAHICGLSEKHFITKFKSVIGVSPKQYIVRCKMKNALELIGSTDAKLSEIATRLGYSDQYSLSKAFRKFYGEPPIAYRKSDAR